MEGFFVLGLPEAAAEMAAFTAVLIAGGWSLLTASPPTKVLTQASGAAFAAVVVGQAATALACKSSTQPVWPVSLLSNRALIAAICAELALLGILLSIPPLPALLGHAVPPTLGWALVLLTAPVVLASDSAFKWFSKKKAKRSNTSITPAGPM